MRVATSDKNAFANIQNRLTDDVGGLIQKIKLESTKNKIAPKVPFWLLIRSLFPIAESVGDLIYSKTSTENLSMIIMNELNDVDARYGRYWPIICTQFRHSLIHTDEMRSLIAKNKTLVWQIEFNDHRSRHLSIEHGDNPNEWCIIFSIETFYKDLVLIIERAKRKEWGGKIEKRYNSWTKLTLDRSSYDTEKKACKIISKF